MFKKSILFLSCFCLGLAADASKKSSSSRQPSTKTTKKSSKSKSKKKFKKVNFESLIKKAEELKTGSLIITQDGKFLVENNWESPLTFYYLQGITSSVVTLALGPLMDEGKIQLDSPLAQWIPEWTDGRAKITVHQILNQTSGFVDDEKEPWYKNSDTWAWAKNQIPKNDPGESFSLSDTNFLLLGLTVAKVIDKDPEALVKKNIFEPLKIQKWSWDKDKFGHSNTAGGLRIRNYDILKIGNLVASDGQWSGQKIISSKWMDEIQRPSEKNGIYGLGWWLHEERGVKALYAFGYQGQFIVVIPERKMVALRLRSLVPVEQNKPEQDWTDFPKELLQLVTRP